MGFAPEVHNKELLVLVSQSWKLHLKVEILSELRSQFYVDPGKLGTSGEESQATGGGRCQEWAEPWA